MKKLLKGMGASKGLVKGKVRIITGPEDVDKLEDNEILVARFTNPLFTPAILRASGIITDMGGILCHAAIVAREIGIPCITGTGKATKVLKDGMEVVVDGEKGVASKGLTEDEMLDIFSDIIAKSMVTVAGKEEARMAIWPAPMANLIEAVYYPAKYYPRFFLELTKKLESKGCSDEEIAKLLKYPSKVAENLWLLQGKGLSQISKEELTEYAIKTLKYIGLLRQGDLFCRDGKNIIWSDTTVKSQSDKIRLLDVEEFELKETVSRLRASLWLYTELLYFAIHAVGHEFHGPYELKNDKILIVREYFDLRIPEIWLYSSKLLFNHIKIFETYDKKLDMKFDIFNRTRSSIAVPDYLKEVCLIVDGKQIEDKKEIEKALMNIQNVMNSGIREITKLDKKKVIEKFAEASFWIAKSLADELNMDWHPPKELYEDIKNDESLKSEFYKKSMEAAKTFPQLPESEKLKIFRNLFDPRI